MSSSDLTTRRIHDNSGWCGTKRDDTVDAVYRRSERRTYGARHEGNIVGFTAHAACLFEQGIVIAVLANAERDRLYRVAAALVHAASP